MGHSVYYNEFDQAAAEWLRNLGTANQINPGQVDERSISDVRSDELIGFERAHFFAGIGGWDLALDLAGWPAGREVWTGSCPCQPFSSAGKRRGDADERHLWPVFRSLISERLPATVFGEQVASKDGRIWFAGVRSDLEALGYAVGGADLCSAGIGSPNIRQRLYWVATRTHFRKGGGKDHAISRGMAYAQDADGRPGERGPETGIGQDEIGGRGLGGRGAADGMAVSDGTGLQPSPRGGRGGQDGEAGDDIGRGGPARGMAESAGSGLEIGGGLGSNEREKLPTAQRAGQARGMDDADGLQPSRERGPAPRRRESENGIDQPSPDRCLWNEFDLIPCRDGTARRAKPGAFPLVNAIPRGLGQRIPGVSSLLRSAGRNRVVRLKGYGNAINPELAAEFIRAFMEAEKDLGA